MTGLRRTTGLCLRTTGSSKSTPGGTPSSSSPLTNGSSSSLPSTTTLLAAVLALARFFWLSTAAARLLCSSSSARNSGSRKTCMTSLPSSTTPSFPVGVARAIRSHSANRAVVGVCGRKEGEIIDPWDSRERPRRSCSSSSFNLSAARRARDSPALRTRCMMPLRTRSEARSLFGGVERPL